MDAARENRHGGETYLMMDNLDIYQIDPEEMRAAQSIAESVNEIVYDQLKATFPEFKMRTTKPFRLQGSVADGTKVLKPDEFDFLIPMDLCAHHWYIETLSKEYCDILRRDDRGLKLDKECVYTRTARIVNYPKIQVKECIYSRRHTTVRDNNCSDQELSWKSSGELQSDCEHCRSVDVDPRADGKNLSRIVFERCSASIKELEGRGNLSSSDMSFNISYVNAGKVNDGPAITVHVRYASNVSLNPKFDELSIDYVPSVCINRRYYVCKKCNIKEESQSNSGKNTLQNTERSRDVSWHWRESFSFDEMRLMKDIRLHASSLFEIYKSFKALQAHLVEEAEKTNRNLTYAEYYEKFTADGLLTDKKYYAKYTHPLVASYSKRSELVRLLSGCCRYYIILILNQGTQHLKTALFDLWKREELRGVDEKTLAAQYVASLNECVKRDHSVKYFNGVQFRSSARNSRYRYKI